MRFEHTRKMHYLPYEVRRDLPVGEWDGITQLFLPSDILDLSQKVFYPKPSQDILSAIAFLAWIPLRQVEEFFTCASKDAELFKLKKIIPRNFGPNIPSSSKILERNL